MQRAPLVSEELAGIRIQLISLHNPRLPYITLVTLYPLLGESVRGEHFVLADLLKSISGSSSQARFALEPQVEIAEGALVSLVRPD